MTDMKDIYVSLEEAKEEIWKRWNDKALRKKVEDFLGGDIPEILRAGPKAVLSRDVITPDHECTRFLDQSKKINLEPVFFEYSQGKFVGKNSDKYHLCKLFFYEGIGNHGGEKISTKRIVDFNKYEGKQFNEIKTIWGENFLKFHHRLFTKTIPGVRSEDIVDFSGWFNKHRGQSMEYYYLHFFSLFISHGILFENFLTNTEEMEFTKNKVLPSFYKIEEMFGIKPLIVPAVPTEEEEKLYWWYYPYKVENIIKSSLEKI